MAPVAASVSDACVRVADPPTATAAAAESECASWVATPAPPTVTAPAGSPLVLGASGMAVGFTGASFTAGDLYSFVAARAVERHLAAANAKVRAKLRRRFPNDELLSWDDSIVAASCSEAALSLLTQRGFDPRNPGDQAVATRAKEGMRYVDEVGASIAHPDGAINGATTTAPEALSDTPAGD